MEGNDLLFSCTVKPAGTIFFTSSVNQAFWRSPCLFMSFAAVNALKFQRNYVAWVSRGSILPARIAGEMCKKYFR
jgi:hypothetical protein